MPEEEELHDWADELAIDVERSIEENGEWIADEMPDFAPRSGKYQVGNGSVIPVEDMMKNI